MNEETKDLETVSEEITEEKKEEEEFNPELESIALSDSSKMNLEDLTAEELLSLYRLSIETKNNPKLNPIPMLPETIRNYIEDYGTKLGFNKNNIAALARELVISFGTEIVMDKKIKEFEKELANAIQIPEVIDFYGQTLKEAYETKFQEMAEKEEDPVKKENILTISKAFTDSYTLEPLMKFFDDQNFVMKINKLLRKKGNKLCDDFDHVLNKVLLKPVSIRSIIGYLRQLYPDMELWRRELFILFLAYYCRNAHKDNKYMMMYMYSSIFNFRSLSSAKVQIGKSKEEEENDELSKEISKEEENNKEEENKEERISYQLEKDDLKIGTNFIDSRMEYLDKFFEKTRELFPDSEFPVPKNMRPLNKSKKAGRTS